MPSFFRRSTDAVPLAPSPAVTDALGTPALFVSYAREDRDFTGRLVSELRAFGLVVAWDGDLVPGPDYWDQLGAAIRSADAVVCVLSPDWHDSEVCRREARFAADAGKRILPVVPNFPLPDEVVRALPDALRRPQWILDSDAERAAVQLAQAASTDFETVAAHTRLGQAAHAWALRQGPPLDRHNLLAAERLLDRVRRLDPRFGLHVGAEMTEYVHVSRSSWRRRLALTAAGVGLALIVSASLGVAWLQTARRRNTEQALKLAFASQTVLRSDDGSATRALLLAREAMQREPSLEADQALRAALALAPLPVALLAHGNAAQTLAFVDSGRYLAQLDEGNRVRLWRTGDWAEVRIGLCATKCFGLVTARAAPLLALEENDGSVTFVNLANGRRTSVKRPDATRFRRVLLSERGSLAVIEEESSQTNAPRIRFVDTRTGGTISFAREPRSLDGALLGGDSLLAGSFRFGGVVVWRARDGAVVHQIAPQATGVREPVAFSADLRCLLIQGDSLELAALDGADAMDCRAAPEFWFGREGERVCLAACAMTPGGAMYWLAGGALRVVTAVPLAPRALPIDETFRHAGVEQAAVSDRGETALTAGDNASTLLHVWRSRGVGEVGRVSYDGKVTHYEGGVQAPLPAFALSPDGATLAVSVLRGDSYDLRIFSTDRYRPETFIPASSIPLVSVPGPGDAVVATGDNSGTVTVQRRADRRRFRLRFGKGRITALAFSRDGSTIAIGDEDGAVGTWRWRATAGRVARGHHDGSGEISAVAISPDGSWLASAGRDNAARLWRLPTMQPGPVLLHADTINRSVTDVAFDPGGTVVVTGSLDGTAVAWDVGSGRVRFRVAPGGWVADVALAADGQRFATVGHRGPRANGAVCVWAMRNGSELFCDEYPVVFNRAAFSPDGSQLAVAAGDYGGLHGTTMRDGAVLLYSVGRRRRIAEWNEPWTVWDVAFSPDGQYVADLSFGNEVGVWSVAGSRQVARFDVPWPGTSLAIGSTGRLIFVPGAGALWRPGDLLAEANRRAVRPLSDDERRTYAP